MKKIIVSFLLFITPGYFIFGNENITAKLTESNFIISGTSTMKNWEMFGKSAEGKAEFYMHENTLSGIRSLQVYVKSAAITGENESMDEKAHKSLKAEEHPLIRYNLRSVSDLQQKEGNISLVATGIISIAGESGWFLTKNILAKIEYVDQNYRNYPDSHILHQGRFNGIIVEGIVAF